MSEKKIIAYKGTDEHMQCRGFQYEVGGEYTANGKIEVCENGFHACKYPLDVFSYYPPAKSRFFIVEQSGALSESDDDSKVASEKLKVSAEIGIPGLVKAAIEYTMKRSKPDKYSATGDWSAASATGSRGAASATGSQSAASATGSRGAAIATGDWSAASATGSQSAAIATGSRGAAIATGDWSAASATGSRGAAIATGDWSAASATGSQSAAIATGSQSAASAAGSQSAAIAAGSQSAAIATGKNSVALAAGYQSKAKGALGCVICIVERDEWGVEAYPIKAAKAAIVDGEELKADTWYTLKNGEFVEAMEE